MFPAGFWSRERVRRFALQLEGERWASAWPPLTARSRRPRTKPLATDGPPTDLRMGTFLRAWLCATACGAPQWLGCTPCGRPPSREIARGARRSSALASCKVETSSMPASVAATRPGALRAPPQDAQHAGVTDTLHPAGRHGNTLAGRRRQPPSPNFNRLVSRRVNPHGTRGTGDRVENDVRGLGPHEWFRGVLV